MSDPSIPIYNTPRPQLGSLAVLIVVVLLCLVFGLSLLGTLAVALVFSWGWLVGFVACLYSYVPPVTRERLRG